jgi:hypothetical protein
LKARMPTPTFWTHRSRSFAWTRLENSRATLLLAFLTAMEPSATRSTPRLIATWDRWRPPRSGDCRPVGYEEVLPPLVSTSGSVSWRVTSRSIS